MLALRGTDRSPGARRSSSEVMPGMLTTAPTVGSSPAPIEAWTASRAAVDGVLVGDVDAVAGGGDRSRR
jgi:hypothetical protein